MSGHGDIPMSVRAMKAGAVDFLTKPFRDQDMLDAVGSAVEIHRSRRTHAPRLAALRTRHDRLSPREMQVMALACAGKQNKQIAAELGIQVITVKVHRGNVMKKMEASSLAELARMAQILEPDEEELYRGIGGTLVPGSIASRSPMRTVRRNWNPRRTEPVMAPLIAIIDDDFGIRNALRSLMRSARYRVETFALGRSVRRLQPRPVRTAS